MRIEIQPWAFQLSRELHGDRHLLPSPAVPIKFGLNYTDPKYKGYTFHTRRAVQSTIADLLVCTVTDYSTYMCV